MAIIPFLVQKKAGGIDTHVGSHFSFEFTTRRCQSDDQAQKTLFRFLRGKWIKGMIVYTISPKAAGAFSLSRDRKMELRLFLRE